tara:strand:- start:1197 stop:1376 length:180 start_codon:yes stop_codon:yes gene_type:complete
VVSNQQIKEKLENIMQDIRDFRDDVYCLSTDTDQPNDCTCYKYDEILDKFENIKTESEK